MNYTESQGHRYISRSMCFHSPHELCGRVNETIKPLNHTPPPSPMSQDVLCQTLRLYIYVWPHSSNIFEFISFQARKGDFWHTEAKRRRVGSGRYELAMAQCISYQEILVDRSLITLHLVGHRLEPFHSSGP